jgi:eukaryotic-like serine/threonine-protein kinase
MGQTTNEFLGTERFRIRRRLGSGGMGVVYEAHDRDMNKLVALKALTRCEAAHITRFKNEFRALANVSHPNLISLYELMSDGKYWFFTMELVQGSNFLEYVRPGYRIKNSPSSKTPTLLKSSGIAAEAGYEPQTEHLERDGPIRAEGGISDGSLDTFVNRTTLDLNRLRNALRQLAKGLLALHATGNLHRDLKPSNVLVTTEGRVVILDFGLVTELESKGLHESLHVAGTPHYMSPEQGAQLPISRASDWYSVGVMLYQALTGKLPFSGNVLQIIMNKRSIDPPPPSELVADIPKELNVLCTMLLHRSPDERASGNDVLRMLGESMDLRNSFVSTASLTSAPHFVGRRQFLDQLHDAFKATTRGGTHTAYIQGSSGMGKSALVRHYLEQLRAKRPDVVILEGRCYGRESMPYKAIDGVIDSLTKYLTRLPSAKAEALMPRDALALARLFPVMLQVNCVSQAPQREYEIPDPFALRRRAFTALRELLGRISDRQPLVVYIDDLQWSDADSISLLEELLRPPDAPPLLLIASFRSEDVETRPFLKSLPNKTESGTCLEISVVPLDKETAGELVCDLLDNVSISDPIVEKILNEAEGSPFLLEQLSRYASTSSGRTTRGISLGVMLEERLQRLPEEARQFVDTLAIAGRPIDSAVAFQAAGFSGDELPLVSSLRANQFLRSSGMHHTVELYHDRIREALAARLDGDAVREIHRRLAQSIEARSIDDPEALYEYYLGAGEPVRAATHAVVAGRKAACALAFDRAADLYRQALKLAPTDGAELLTLKTDLAEALVNAGRPAEAAQTFSELAHTTSGTRSLDFKRRAAEQLLMGGHIKEGLELTRSLLNAIGFSFPSGPRRALLSLILKRIRIRFRGFSFVERDEMQISDDDLFRIDMCWAIARGLGAVDLVRGADFHCRHLLLSLRAGETFRVARAMAFETAQSVAPGGRTRERGLQLAERTQELAQKVGHPHALGMSFWASGIAAYLGGQWKKGAELCERASEILRDQCTGVMWELGMARRFMLSSLLYLGEVGEVARRVPDLLSMALEQGNIFFATDLRTRMNLIWLAADDPYRARVEVIDALKAWPNEGFHLQHYSAMFALTQIGLYTGDAGGAWEHVHEQWKRLEQSMLLHNQVLRIEATHLKGRAALHAARSSACTASKKESLLKIAERMAQRIAKERMLWAGPLADLLQAGVASCRGDRSSASVLLSGAIEDFERSDMGLYAAAARTRLGEIVGAERGRKLVTEGETWMSRQQIMNPSAMNSVLAPGFN